MVRSRFNTPGRSRGPREVENLIGRVEYGVFA
jgi:hypothetical protein